MNRLSFRQKIFFYQLLLFFVFILLLFPMIEQAVKQIMRNSLEERVQDLIEKIQDAPSEREMVQRLKDQEFFIFFRITLINSKGELLYDESVRQYFGEKYIPNFPLSLPEVEEALRKGKGYREGESQIFVEQFAYLALAFDFQRATYVLRAALPLSQVHELTKSFEIGFLLFSSSVLLIFSGILWLVFNRLSRPIQQITRAIKQDPIPEIVLPKGIREEDDFGRLAKTLNSLSERIHSQIKYLTEERNEKEAILESLGEGVIAVDAEMHLHYANLVGSKMAGFSRKGLIGKPLPKQGNTPLLERARALLELCQEQGRIVTDSISLTNGKKIYFDLIAAPKGKGRGAIIVLQDKSSHYKVLEMGKDFVANASHELRTPITIIRGFAETLQDLPEISSEMLMDITEKIVRNCQRMDTLVKNLLTLSDIENIPERRFKKCNLPALIDNCRHLLLSVYSDTQITVEKNREEIYVSVDPDLLELAIMNLFDNAVKYSLPPTHIAITIQQEEEDVKISIKDHGIGIPPTDLEQIFERFYTVNKAHSRRLGGAGLGLSIVKTIIEKHDGTIFVSSEVGVGTTFLITLPLAGETP
jgi:two-component system, OmpR family, phosphate regulon sensor histidine kinase PhoR